MQIGETIKVRLTSESGTNLLFFQTAYQYMLGCNFVSEWIFQHDFCINSNEVQKHVYYDLRELFGLKAQMAVSCIKTVTARYQTVDTQMRNNPYRFTADGKHYSFHRDMT